MTRFNVYSTRFGEVHRNMRGGVSGLPGWGRVVVALAALPGLVLLAAAIAVGLLAIAVLMLTAGVAYWLVMKVNGLFTSEPQPTRENQRQPHSRRVEATVLENE